MKIIYLIKKGLQFFPPCLNQILFLNDLGMEVEVYHGKNSRFIDSLLDKRMIVHHTFKTDRQSQNKLDQVINFLTFSREIKTLQKQLQQDAVLWIGNLETAMTMDKRNLSERKFILNVLELYDEGTMYDRYLKKMADKAELLICCEKHRAAIMQSRYNLKRFPTVIPNKPYDLQEVSILREDIKEQLKRLEGKFMILYQGIITPDRPLALIAQALKNIDDPNLVFVYMGRCDDHSYPAYLKSIYPESYYLGYIPAPEHLEVTKLCQIGIANYDYSNLNNVFCAPNKIYEYTKFGKPILASQNIGLTETVGAAGAAVCVDFRNVREIVNGISKIRDDYRNYSIKAERFYNDIDIKNIIKGLVL